MKHVMMLCMTILALAGVRDAIADRAPWQGDPMEVEGERIPGSNVLCRGSGCASVLDSLYRDYLYDLALLLDRPALLEGGTLPEFTVDAGEFCGRLEEERPSGCSKSSPPSVPGLDPAWRPNGCGVGGWRDGALSLMARLGIRHFTGDLDNPFPGVSFLGACNAHDACYGYQVAKLACDADFRLAMTSACNANTANATRELCYGAVSAYHLAVTSHGGAAYRKAGEELACARWHLDMRANGCRS